MPVEGGVGVLNAFSLASTVKPFIILFLVFYTVFAIILERQVKIMSRKLPTPLSPHLKFIAFINIGISVAILFLVIGLY